MPRLNQ
nr:unnamed protein product [Callosobruchus chinensis]